MSCVDELHTAIYQNKLAQVKKLMKSCGDERDSDGRTPLHIAVLDEEADLKIVKAIVAAGSDVNAADRQGFTSLHFAARDGRDKIVSLLLDHNAEVDALDSWGNTPLFRCVMSQPVNTKIARQLLEAGANPKKKNKSKVSPLDVAKKCGDEDIVTMFSGKR